jgi:hypothetical protein
MSLSADKMWLNDIGEVRISEHGVEVLGFSGHQCSCRDVAALALVWAIERLGRELRETMREPGGGNVGIG